MNVLNTHPRRLRRTRLRRTQPGRTHPGRNGRRFALAVLVPLLAIVWLSARVDPTQAQSSPNGSVPVDKGELTIAGDIQPDRDMTFAAAVSGPTAFAVDLRGDNELLNVTRPDVVASIHDAFLLRLLYHPALRPGMKRRAAMAAARAVLPAVRRRFVAELKAQ